MVCVPTPSVPDYLSKDGRAPRLGVPELLEHQDACSLAEDKAAPVLVEGPGGEAWRVIVARGEGLHPGEAGDRQDVDAGLRPARHHDVSLPVAYHAKSVSDAVGAAGAGRGHGVVRAPQAVLDAHQTGRHVGQHVRDEVGADPPLPSLAHEIAHRVEGRGIAHPSADGYASPGPLRVGERLPPRLGQGLLGGDLSEL